MIKRLATAFLVAAAIAATLVGCSDSDSPGNRPLILGSTDDPAMSVMVQIYAGALRHTGVPVSAETRTGSYRGLLDEMDEASLDLFPAFTGRLLRDLAPQVDTRTAEDVYRDVNRSLPQGVSVGDATMVSALPEVFVATSVAEQAQVTALTDCGRLPDLPIVVVGKPDKRTIDAIEAAGCRTARVESVPNVSSAVARITAGTAVGVLTPLDVAVENARQGGGDADATSAIRALHLPERETSDSVVAGATPQPEQTTGIPRAEELVPVYRTAVFGRDRVKTLNKVAGELTTADLATLTGRAVGGEKPDVLAAEWLAEHGL